MHQVQRRHYFSKPETYDAEHDACASLLIDEASMARAVATRHLAQAAVDRATATTRQNPYGTADTSAFRNWCEGKLAAEMAASVAIFPPIRN